MSTSIADLFPVLADIVGRQHVLRSHADLEEYALDAFPQAKAEECLDGPAPLPGVVVRPGSTSEVQQIVRLAGGSGTPVVPYGGGTGVMGAAVPAALAIVVDLRRLDQVLEVSAEGQTVQVQAGMLLEDLDRYLAGHGLMLGHDPWSRSIATVGGAISTDGVGYLAARYGTMGEQVLALEVVLPNGDLMPMRRVSVAAGPRMYSLFIGAEGTLGIITAALLRVFPAPERRAVRAVEFPDFASGYGAIAAMAARGVRPSMIDYSEEPLTGPARAVLYLAFEGMASESKAHEAEGMGLCEAHGATELGEAEAHRFWDTRHAAAEAWASRNAKGRRFVRAQGWGTMGWLDYLHVSLPPERVLAYKSECETLLREAGLASREYAIWGRPDLFSVVVTCPDEDKVDRSRAAETSQRLLSMAQDLGGSMEYCHGVGLKLRSMMPRELGQGMTALREIKRALDPANIMNPCKMSLET